MEQILDSLVPKTVGGGRLDVKEVVKSSEAKSLSCSATPPLLGCHPLWECCVEWVGGYEPRVVLLEEDGRV